MHKTKRSKATKRILSFIMMFAVVLTVSGVTSTIQANAASLLRAGVNVQPDFVGTYDDAGKYMYSCTIGWERSPQAVNGYYLAVQRASDGVWVIKETVYDIGCMQLSLVYEDIYGLRPGYYRFYVSAIDANNRVLDTHYGVYAYVDYSSTDYGYTTFE